MTDLFPETLTSRHVVSELPMECRVDRAIDLLRMHEPSEGYWLAFSGGKDSIVIKKLAQLSGVKFEARYSNTTIDPPELYCSLYDEGWTRLGCVGCPLASKENQDREFARWPAYERNWKKAIIANWEKWKDQPNTKTGQPRYHAKFKDGEEFWLWWRTHRVPDLMREECQGGLLFTNQ